MEREWGWGWTRPLPFHWSHCRLMWFHVWFVDCWEIQPSFFSCLTLKQLMTLHSSWKHKNKRIKQIRRTNRLNPERRERLQSHCQNHLCSVSLWLSLYSAFYFFFNCWIIHLRALIYPPSSALYVRPSCETFSGISNELVAYKVFLPGKAPIYGHVCLLFIKINPLGEDRPYAIFKIGPRNVLGLEVTLF